MRMRIASMLLTTAVGLLLISAPAGGQPATAPARVVVQPGPAAGAVAPPDAVVVQPGQAIVLQPGQSVALYVQPTAPASIATPGPAVGFGDGTGYETDSLHRLEMPRSFEEESRTPSER
ncbi:MAG: hypothetical protein ACREMB_14650 [Candidatus Rokuibacteriota bacterium]